MSQHTEAQLARVAAAGPIAVPGAAAAMAVSQFARGTWRLPTMFGTPMIAHGLSPRVPASPRLRALVAGLRGRLAVVNPTSATRAPVGLIAAVRGLVRGRLESGSLDTGSEFVLDRRAGVRAGPASAGDTRAAYERRMVRTLLDALPADTAARLAAGVRWAALALYESPAPTIHFGAAGGVAGATPNAMAAAILRYRLVLAAGSGPLADWAELDAAAAAAPAIGWPIRRYPRPAPDQADGSTAVAPWFVVPMLVPDAWIVAHADRETLARWASLTGRAGQPDRYWFPDTWDRFLEPGRRIGCVSPIDVCRPRRGRLATAARVAELDPDESGRGYGGRSGGLAPATLNPDVERGVCVPPGYALVQCVGVLAVSVVIL